MRIFVASIKVRAMGIPYAGRAELNAAITLIRGFYETVRKKLED